jgi:glutathione synthase/RimK-type ligase-like ATP-grasp enzyme
MNGIICKRIIDSYYYKNEEYIYNFNSTFLLDSKLLRSIPGQFALSLFQERILSEFEVRVIYVKGKFYAMSVHIFDEEIDYRVNLNSMKNIRTIPFNLPVNIKKKLRNIFKNLHLNYGSVDLMYYKDEFYFLEINPSGQISFVNEACNFYIEEEISKMLKNGK